MSSVTQQTVESIDGIGIEIRRSERASIEPALVLLHEGLGCIALWRSTPDTLEHVTNRSVVAYSRPGYGGSDPIELPRPLDYLQREANERLGHMLDAFGFDRVVLVGHSDGASIAIVYAGMAKDPRLAGLVLIAPHVFCEDLSVTSIRATRRRYLTTGLRDRLARYHGTNVDTAFWGWSDTWLDPAFRAWSIESYLPNIEVPTLVIQGEDDEYGTIEHVRAIESGIAGPITIQMIAGAGHSPHLDQPTQTLSAIASFVAKNCST
ncbi:MAG: alpha/beta fold hydrolase [Ferrimicrobium sp.]